ncbi:hypothetical protein EYB26_001757 [Talaromyces marneffei]|uniref:uncharacterized protein n=1 Tax=Talaromyces marneffei TaxID=37727 RepID=UPI0012A951E7|nr:uncharacterized protein EYB26_001757 [Talaromyces marneffei]QGA14104.1 hypothetical protein EYB26_001757 [Talaromyces marneffei]
MAAVRTFVLFSFTSPPSLKASKTPEFVNCPSTLSRSAASAVIFQKTWKPINRQLNGLSPSRVAARPRNANRD